MTRLSDHYVVFEDAGTCLAVGLAQDRLPIILYWGVSLGQVDEEVLRTLDLQARPAVAGNVVDEPQPIGVLPEHWTGWVGRPGLSGSRADGRSWSPRFAATTAELNGVEISQSVTSTGPAVLVARSSDDTAGLSVAITVEMLTGGLCRMRASVTNDAADEYRVNDLVLAYPVPPVAAELMDYAGHWGKERQPQRREFNVGTHLREGRKGRTGFEAATVLHAGTPGFGYRDGEVWGVHVAWSGNHTHYAERTFTGDRVLGGGELLLPGELSLETDETYESPWVYGAYGRGLDGVAHRFHTYLRSRPQHPSPQRPVAINVWEAVYFDHRLEPLIELADLAASLGIERFVLDDGWFGSRRDDTSGLGDWVVSHDIWPNGLHPLIDHVKSLGMQFGLWFEPEMVNPDSDVARAHPEWIMSPEGRWPVESRHQQVMNIGIPEAYAHVRDQMMAILDEYAIDYIKWDHNRDLIEAGTQPSGRPGVHEQTLATYRLMDELKAAHPHLEIESCSSGGGRIDLGVLQHTDRVWVSDVIDPFERQIMLPGTSQLLPPELLGSHIASGMSHSTGRTHDLDFRAGTALFGHLGIEWDIRQASDQELQQLAGWIALFKANRETLFTGDYVRIDFPDKTLVGVGVVAQDRSEALYSLASVGISVSVERGCVRLPGLDPNRRYRVTPVELSKSASGLWPPLWWQEDEGVVASGAVLESMGIRDAAVNPDHVVVYQVKAVD